MKLKIDTKTFVLGFLILLASVWALFYLRFLASSTWMIVPVTFTCIVLGLIGLAIMVYSLIKE